MDNASPVAIFKVETFKKYLTYFPPQTGDSKVVFNSLLLLSTRTRYYPTAFYFSIVMSAVFKPHWQKPSGGRDVTRK